MNREPLFNILAFFAVIAVVALIGYYLGRKRVSDNQKTLDKFLNGFALTGSNDFKELGALVSLTGSFVEPLCMLAKGYAHSGEFEKAIALLQSVLSNMPKLQKNKEVIVLKEIAEIYLEAGMLYRATETVMQILRLESRNTQALQKLVILREMQGEYQKAIEAINVLRELGCEDIKSHRYLQALLDRQNGKKSKNDGEYFLRQDFQEAIEKNENIEEFIPLLTYQNSMDILWYCNSSHRGDICETVCNAKNGLDVGESAPFALKVISKIGRELNADLSFAYKCSSCGHEDTIFFGRCPKCHDIESCSVMASVVPKISFESAMFT